MQHETRNFVFRVFRLGDLVTERRSLLGNLLFPIFLPVPPTNLTVASHLETRALLSLSPSPEGTTKKSDLAATMENLAAGSAGAPRLPGLTWQKKPAVASVAGFQGWALLDPSILEEDPAANSTGLAVGTASDNRAVRVSLRLTEPPASSYVQLHTDADLHVEPTLLSADGHLLLVHMVVAVVRDPPFTSFEDNFFVYKPHPNPSMGWLRLLPQFADRVASVRHTGIACRGQDYVVAGFLNMVVGDEAATWGENQLKEVGTLSRFSSSTGRWDILELPIPFDTEKGLHKFVWESDNKFALGGYMFWVDYHRGMLYCDVFAESPSLQFIELPGIHIWGEDHDYSQGRQLPEAHRIVGVSRGQVKFVDIDNGLFGTQKTSGFTITTWSLSMNDLQWVKDAVVEVDDLWLLPEFLDSPLPRWVPEYPILNKHDSNILHLILRGPQSNAKAWVITLDMREKALKSYRPFINERKLDYEGYDLDTRNMFCDTTFVCCDFGCLDTGRSFKIPSCQSWPMWDEIEFVQMDNMVMCTRYFHLESHGNKVERKSESALVSASGIKKRKGFSSTMDFLELSDTSASTDDINDVNFSDSKIRNFLCTVRA
ncbi:hypothetical protein EJB05_24668 [Eragrostis curvula]|uniref:DUF1618 domain-containing protein n=1 Tax=Eragrostis curvula TaxID=38414 RepID=A0A5J9VA29_9POAL|nr:hypothetical protein EJB05_24668 [Eragrostis curvula]